jgi:hypothetical protein
MNSKELNATYGRSIKPKVLADFLGLDQRTVIKYADFWGGVQVSPGRYRFFENRIKEILDDAWFDKQTREKALEGQHHGRGRFAPKSVPGRYKKNVQESRRMGNRKKERDGKRPNRHGLLDDPTMV